MLVFYYIFNTALSTVQKCSRPVVNHSKDAPLNALSAYGVIGPLSRQESQIT